MALPNTSYEVQNMQHPQDSYLFFFWCSGLHKSVICIHLCCLSLITHTCVLCTDVFLIPLIAHVHYVCSLSRYQQFKDFQRRILVATNLFGRGMDIERVNIAFNYDMPEDSDTYLHRVRLSHTQLIYT